MDHNLWRKVSYFFDNSLGSFGTAPDEILELGCNWRVYSGNILKKQKEVNLYICQEACCRPGISHRGYPYKDTYMNQMIHIQHLSPLLV